MYKAGVYVSVFNGYSCLITYRHEPGPDTSIPRFHVLTGSDISHAPNKLSDGVAFRRIDLYNDVYVVATANRRLPQEEPITE